MVRSVPRAVIARRGRYHVGVLRARAFRGPVGRGLASVGAYGRLGAALAAITLGGCASLTPLDPVSQQREARRIVERLADPAMEGRGAGTRGLEVARDYLIRRFKAMGLEPAFGDGQASARRGHDQALAVTLAPQVADQSLVVHVDAGATEGTKGRSIEAEGGQGFNALGFSGDGTFEGPLVFVGYGIVQPRHGYDSYNGLGPQGLDGAVAVAFRYEPQDEKASSKWGGSEGAGARLGQWSSAASLIQKAAWASDHGASALLVVNPPSQDHGDLKSVGSSGVGGPSSIPVMHVRSSLFCEMLEAAGMDPAVAMRQWQRRADRGATRVDPIEGLTARGQVRLTRETTTVANVAGFVRGQGALADQIVVIGAHYDHLGYGQVGSLAGEGPIHPGADDNASGTAGLVLLAERFVQRGWGDDGATGGAIAQSDDGAIGGGDDSPSRGSEHRGRRSLLFVAFAGEELGLLGSVHLLKHLDQLGVSQDQLVAMVNFDMVGRMEGRKLYVMGTDSSSQWEAIVADAAAHSGLDVDVRSHAFGGSDHAAFQHRGIPALHLFTGAHGDYHRPSDTAEKVNVEGLVAVVDFAESVVEQAATAHDRIAFDAAVESGIGVDRGAGQGGPHGGTGGGARLGIMPDYGSQGEEQGCAVAAVTRGGPAQAAGLADGDVIVAWDDKPVRGVMGLMTVLRSSRPGQEVVVTVLRGEQELKLKVTLGSR